MDTFMESPPPPPPPHQLAELIQSLDLATQMLKQLPTTADPTHQQVIFSALHSAHQSLSTFLSSHYPPASPITAFAAANSYPENSVSSSAVGTAVNAAEPMQMTDYDGGGDGGEDEQNSKDSSMDRVEEKMRDFNIQNKRPKRPLSPTSAAMEERPRMEDRLSDRVESAPVVADSAFSGARVSMLRSLDLIYQFYS